MKCRNCGASVERNLIVCPECGEDPKERVTEISDAQLGAVTKQLVKKWWVKIAAALGLLTLIIGGSVREYVSYTVDKAKESINAQLLEIQTKAKEQLSAAREAVEKDIRDQLQAEKYQMLVQNVATAQATEILKSSVDPAVAAFKSNIETRLTDFDSYLKSQRESIATDIGKLRSEIAKLERRNELTALADKAISNGDVDAYRKLSNLTEVVFGTPEAGAYAELFRVFHAYSIFSPTRWRSVKLIPSVFNPAKTREEDLTAEEILPMFTRVTQPEARGRMASLLSERAKVGSYTNAASIIEALRVERHLEVIRRLRDAFQRVTGHDEPGRLDARELIDWWEKNKDDLKAKDTDKKG